MAKIYRYGMRLRGFSPGAQPMQNLIQGTDDPKREYYSVLEYSSPLSSEDIRRYELDLIDIRERYFPFDEIS